MTVVLRTIQYFHLLLGQERQPPNITKSIWARFLLKKNMIVAITFLAFIRKITLHRVYVFIFTYCPTMMIMNATKFDLFNSVNQIVKRCTIILIVVKTSLIEEPLSKPESIRTNLLFDGFQSVLEVVFMRD